MPAGSAWASAWGDNWAYAWGPSQGVPTPPPGGPPPPSGGYPSGDRGPTKRQVRESRRRFGLELEAEEAVHEVAARQVERLEQDEAKRTQELIEEMRLRRIEARAEHFAALAAERQRLIDAEIAWRIRERIRADEDAAAILLAIAAAISP